MHDSLNISVQQLRYLLAIAEAGSIAGAARALAISKGTLANTLAQVDSKLGFSVFHGSRKGVEETSQGTEFLGYARRVVSEMSLLDERFGKTAGANAPCKLSVATTPFCFAVEALANVAKAHEKNDRSTFAINISYAPQIAIDVCTNKRDMGVLHLSKKNEIALRKLIRDEGLEFHELFTTRFYAYMHKEHPLANHKSIKYAELALYPSFDLEQYLYLRLSDDGSQTTITSDSNWQESFANLLDPVETALDTMANSGVCLIYCNLTEFAVNSSSSNGVVAVPLDTDQLMHMGYIIRRDHSLTDIEQEYVAALMRFAQQKGLAQH